MPDRLIIPAEFLCPITQDIMTEPVTAGDGQTYERRAIQQWLEDYGTSPLTRQQLTADLLQPNSELENKIKKFQQENAEALMAEEHEQQTLAEQQQHQAPIVRNSAGMLSLADMLPRFEIEPQIREPLPVIDTHQTYPLPTAIILNPTQRLDRRGRIVVYFQDHFHMQFSNLKMSNLIRFLSRNPQVSSSEIDSQRVITVSGNHFNLWSNRLHLEQAATFGFSVRDADMIFLFNTDPIILNETIAAVASVRTSSDLVISYLSYSETGYALSSEAPATFSNTETPTHQARELLTRLLDESYLRLLEMQNDTANPEPSLGMS